MERYNALEINKAISLLTIPGEVYELRTVGKTFSGYFNDPVKLAAAAKKVSGTAGVDGVYLTINPVKPELLARTGGNDIITPKNGGTTSDKDIIHRRGLVIDIDSATRASGISATDEEKRTAYALAEKVQDYLTGEGWPLPLVADSGNGFHLRYNIDLPNDQDSRNLIDAVLKSLAAKFNDEVNKVDTTLSNASRICKLYGTLSAKGVHMEDRPHRINFILAERNPIIITKEQLERIAKTVVYPNKTVFDFSSENYPAIKTVSDGLKLKAALVVHHNWTEEEMEAILDGYQIEYNKMNWAGGWKWQINCQFDENHHSPDAYTMIMPDQQGKFYPIYKCSHDSCSTPRWKAFVSKLKQNRPEISVPFFEDTTSDLGESDHIIHNDPIYETKIPSLDYENRLGDYIGDLSFALTDGTFIPIGFARATLKAILGAVLDGKIGFPGEEFLHMRHWNALVSARPEAGKGEIWRRLSNILNESIFKTYDIELPKSGFFSSGEHAIKTLAMNDGKPHLAYFDEMKGLFDKGSAAGSTLFSRLLELYEQKSGGVGSLTHNTATFENVSLSMTGGFTIDGFEHSISGKGVGGDGFLSRMILEYSDGIEYEGDWKSIDGTKTNPALRGIKESLQYVYQEFENRKESGLPFIPIEDRDAKEERLKFQKWLIDQKKIIEKEMPGSSYASRIESHFKRDLLIRTVFTPEKKITKELVLKSIEWAKHQLYLRKALWPVDRGDNIEKCEKKILKAIREQGPLTKTGIQMYSGAETGAGGFNAWNPAWRNVLQSGYIQILSQKTKKKEDVFGLRDKKWNYEETRWESV